MFALHFYFMSVPVLCLWFAWKFRRILPVAYRLPAAQGVCAYPVVGHFHYILLGFTGLSNLVVKQFKEMARISKSSTIVWWFGCMPLFLLFDPEDIQTVLNSRATREKGPEIHVMKYAVGGGILSAPWEYWKMLRRHVNPLFHSNNLNHLVPVINKCGRDLTLNLSRHVGKGQVDVQPYVYDVALASTCNLLFGSDFKVNVGSEPFKEMSKAIESVSYFLTARLMRFWLWPELMFKTLYRKRIHNMETSFKEYFQKPISDFESRRESNSMVIVSDNISNDKMGTNVIDTPGIDGTQLTIVDVYAQFQKTIDPHFTKTDFRKEIVTFMLAGSDTTKVVVSSCLLALSVHPEIQERLYAEVASVMGNEEDVSLEHLKNMPYLDQVFKETLRWFLIIPGVTKTVKNDLKIKALTLPAGSTVGVSLAGVHRDPRFYPDPDRFDPDNFLPERVVSRPKYAFVPFSGGPRGCIGKHYSMMTVKTFLIHVLRKYKLSSDVDINSLNNLPGLAFSFLEGYKIQFEHR